MGEYGRRLGVWAWFLVGLLGVLVPTGCARGANLNPTWPPPDGFRVLFLGDSITQGGTYIRYVDALLSTRLPDRTIEVINLGLSSETVSGLTEPVHPYPRPNVRDRLARALEMTRPQLVFVCYGMNDGIYHPPSAERTRAYQQGIEAVVAAVRASGAEVIVGTPPPFDPEPIRRKTVPLDAPEFGYGHPFVGYDGVLGLYSNLLLDHAASDRDSRDRWTVADIHTAGLTTLRALRAHEPDAKLAKDGVHPGGDGHWLIARPYLEAWGVPADVDAAALACNAEEVFPVRGRVVVDPGPRPADGSIRFTWTTRIPMPHDPSWTPEMVALERLDERFNRHRLTVVGLDRPRYAFFEGDGKLGEASREELADGLDLLRFPALSTNLRAARTGALIARKHEILDSAWLEAVGHGRPNFPKTRSLDEARREAEPLLSQIRDLAQPAPISLRLVPLGE